MALVPHLVYDTPQRSKGMNYFKVFRVFTGPNAKHPRFLFTSLS